MPYCCCCCFARCCCCGSTCCWGDSPGLALCGSFCIGPLGGHQYNHTRTVGMCCTCIASGQRAHTSQRHFAVDRQDIQTMLPTPPYPDTGLAVHPISTPQQVLAHSASCLASLSNAALPRSTPHTSAMRMRYSSTPDSSWPTCWRSAADKSARLGVTSPFHWKICASTAICATGKQPQYKQ